MKTQNAIYYSLKAPTSLYMATNGKMLALSCTGEIRRENLIQGLTTMADLPPEIMTEILWRFPAKSLVELRFVCRSWFSFISSHPFVRKHATLSTLDGANTPKRKIIMRLHDCIDRLVCYSFQDSYQSTSINFFREELPDYPLKNLRSEFYFDILGSCDGLVCVLVGRTYTSPHSIFLWNPCTRDYKILPDVGESSYVWKYGFGYDYKSDDYKVVITLMDYGPDQTRIYKSMLYTLRTKSWRRIQDYPHDGNTVDSKSSVFVRGALHWLVKINSTMVINALDLASETYLQVPKPDYSSFDNDYRLGTSSGCLFIQLPNCSANQYELWVMKEYGVRESWTKSIIIPFCKLGRNHLHFSTVTWFSGKGIILFNFHERRFALYNAKENSIIDPTDHYDGWFHPYGHYVYVESLVSPNAYDKLEANTS